MLTLSPEDVLLQGRQALSEGASGPNRQANPTVPPARLIPAAYPTWSGTEFPWNARIWTALALIGIELTPAHNGSASASVVFGWEPQLLTAADPAGDLPRAVATERDAQERGSRVPAPERPSQGVKLAPAGRSPWQRRPVTNDPGGAPSVRAWFTWEVVAR